MQEANLGESPNVALEYNVSINIHEVIEVVFLFPLLISNVNVVKFCFLFLAEVVH